MVKYNHTPEQYFDALGQRTRRVIVEALARCDQLSVSDLQKQVGISLPGTLKHVRVLEQRGLITSMKDGRTLYCSLNRAAFHNMIDWMLNTQQFWNQSIDRLETHLSQSTSKNKK